MQKIYGKKLKITSYQKNYKESIKVVEANVVSIYMG